MFNPQKIKDLINERGCTQASVYNGIQMSRKAFTDIVNGVTKTPRVDSIEAFADYFNVPMDYFFDRACKNPDIYIGHRVSGVANSVSGDIALSECRTEVEHLRSLLAEKERTIQILLKNENR